MKYVNMHEIPDCMDWKLMCLAWAWYDICLYGWLFLWIDVILVCMGTLWLIC